MLTQEQAVEVRVMARQGKGIREIAREMGISRNTVRRYLREGGTPAYKARSARPTKLDPYKGYLTGRVRQARPMWLPATVPALGLWRIAGGRSMNLQHERIAQGTFSALREKHLR